MSSDGQVVGHVRRSVHGIVVDEVPAGLLVHPDDLLLLLAHGVDDAPRTGQVVLDELVGDHVHVEDLLALDVDRALQAEVAPQGAGRVVELDALAGVHDRVHQDQEVIAPLVALLMLEQEIHERLFELEHEIPSPQVRCRNPPVMAAGLI
jgi:hypothetical protein